MIVLGLIAGVWGLSGLLVLIATRACHPIDSDLNARVATLEDELDELIAHPRCALTVTLPAEQPIDAELVRLVATRGLTRNRSRWS